MHRGCDFGGELRQSLRYTRSEPIWEFGRTSEGRCDFGAKRRIGRCDLFDRFPPTRFGADPREQWLRRSDEPSKQHQRRDNRGCLKHRGRTTSPIEQPALDCTRKAAGRNHEQGLSKIERLARGVWTRQDVRQRL